MLSRNAALMFVEQRPRVSQTLQSLVEEGVPVQEGKYRWTAADKTKLNAAIRSLATNEEQPPRPPGKSPVTWLREEIFTGFGPTEEQIRRMLLNLRFN